MSCDFIFEIAGHSIQLRTEPGFENEIVSTYGLFFSDKAPQILLDIQLSSGQLKFGEPEIKFSFDGRELFIRDGYSQGRFNLSDKRGELILSKNMFMFSLGTYLRNILTLLVVLEDNGLVLHAAGIVKDGKSFIFIGPSGAGKSTVSRISADKIILSDEMQFIKKIGKDYFVCPVPNWDDRQSNLKENRPYGLAGIFKLIKDKKVFCKRLSPAMALADIYTLPQLPLKFLPKEQLTDTFIDLLNCTPYYGLHFLPDDSFWPCIDRLPELEYA